jgi:hypothetical protein
MAFIFFDDGRNGIDQAERALATHTESDREPRSNQSLVLLVVPAGAWGR